MDFFVWFQDRGRFGIQVKGGMYSVEGTDWTFQTVNGPEYVGCPVTGRLARPAVAPPMHRESRRAGTRDDVTVAVRS